MKGVVLLAGAGGIWTLSLPLYLDLVLGGLLFATILISGPLESVLVGGSLLVSLFLVEVFFTFAGPGIPQFYREHEKYGQPDQTYRPNVDDSIGMPHGDLAAIDPMAPVSMREPRTVRFVTDALGYRNEREYSGQKFILVGDSFVVGNGTDQREILTSIMRTEYHLDSYSIGYPSDPIDYERRAAWFLSAINPNVSFLIFYYEGNDFIASDVPGPVFGEGTQKLLPTAMVNLLDAYDRWRREFLSLQVGGLHYPKIIFGMSRRLERSFFLRSLAQVPTVVIAGKTFGFVEFQNLPTTAGRLSLFQDFNPQVLAHTACAFFVPTKLRAYKAFLPMAVQTQIQEPAPGFVELQRNFAPFGIPVINLTPILRLAAVDEMKQGRFVFWRDDTHWNGLGMRAVAPQVFRCAQLPRGTFRLPAIPSDWDYRLQSGQLRSADSTLELGPWGRYFIDSVVLQNQNYIISGWATNQAGTERAKRVLAFAGATLVSSTTPSIPRHDVALAVGPGGEMAGFSVSIPRNLVTDSEVPIRMFMILPSNKAVELILAPTILQALMRAHR